AEDGIRDATVTGVQTCALPISPGRSPRSGSTPVMRGNRLFRNDLTRDGSGRPVLRFTDVTEQSGLANAKGYGMGAAVGDYDNDRSEERRVGKAGKRRR